MDFSLTKWVVWLAAAFLLAGCQDTPSPASNSPSLPNPGSSAVVPWSVYFTDPASPTADSYRGGPDAFLVEAIQKARMSLDVAILELNLWSVRDALIEAHRRGVTVRVVTEGDNLDWEEIQDLHAAGIPVVGDQGEGLMHNKFVVVDGREVWTGSMNFTLTDGYRNNNNLVRIQSQPLAEDYIVEFEEMFAGQRFGEGSPANTPYPSLDAADFEVEIFFSPEDGAADRIVALLREARSSILFMAFSFTSDDIANAMVAQSKSGVQVQGVMEATQARSNAGTEYERLLRGGVEVRLDGNPRNMHHKVIILDEATVICGSYNFTRNAEEVNDENMLILYNPEIAARFVAEFQSIFAQAQP
jgi:phosphatidylserine/phosphatidylglycerophosphate/cardiolipin synthase-like enzyme